MDSLASTLSLLGSFVPPDLSGHYLIALIGPVLEFDRHDGGRHAACLCDQPAARALYRLAGAGDRRGARLPVRRARDPRPDARHLLRDLRRRRPGRRHDRHGRLLHRRRLQDLRRPVPHRRYRPARGVARDRRQPPASRRLRPAAAQAARPAHLRLLRVRKRHPRLRHRRRGRRRRPRRRTGRHAQRFRFPPHHHLAAGAHRHGRRHRPDHCAAAPQRRLDAAPAAAGGLRACGASCRTTPR